MTNYNNGGHHRLVSPATMADEAEVVLGLHIERVNVPLGLIYSGQFTLLRFGTWGQAHYRLRGVCPHCGQACWSVAVSNGAELLRIATDFTPSEHHRPLCGLEDGVRYTQVARDLTTD